MTASIENRIDEWMTRVKGRVLMDQFVFIPGFPPHKTPNPVTNYTVAVANSEEKVARYFIGDRIGKMSEGKLYEVRLMMRVYAPERASGAALLRASALLADAFEAEDCRREISAMTFSGIGYDTAARCEYRDVTIQLMMAVEEEADG